MEIHYILIFTLLVYVGDPKKHWKKKSNVRKENKIILWEIKAQSCWWSLGNNAEHTSKLPYWRAKNIDIFTLQLPFIIKVSDTR